MSKVLITKDLLDDLADAVASKTSETTPMTIEEMTEAIEDIEIPSAGTEGTPVATKGTVSNHSISVTPSVTNIGGVIQGGTHTGTAVTVSASELVSGTKSISSNGSNIDVTNYEKVNVSVDGGGGDNVLIVTLSWDDDYFGQGDGAWVPDCTFAEIQAAYNAGKEIAVGTSGDTEACEGFFIDDDPDILFIYWVIDSLHNGGINGFINYSYIYTSNGVALDDSNSYIYPEFSSLSKTYTPTESTQTETIAPGQGYNGIEEVNITINPISSSYVGSGITRRSSSDLSVSNATITAPAGYYASQASTSVASGSAGTPTATKGTVSNHAISVTPSVTNTTGYITGGTKTGTAVSVAASEVVSGTYNVTSSGTKDVTNYASASVPAGTQGTPTATKGTVSNHSVSVTPSVTNSAGYISGGTKTGTAVSVSASELVSGTTTVTTNSTIDVTNLAQVVVNVSGGGGDSSAMQIDITTKTLTSSAQSISFTGLNGEPTSFIVLSNSDLATGTPAKTAAVVFDGTDLHGQTITNTSNAQVSYDGSNFSKSYSSGTLTITGSSYWQANEYTLVYTYNGTGGNINTADVQVGSGATSITFTGLEDQPNYFSCIFKSNFSTSSGYQRVIAVVYDGSSVYGLQMDSGAKYSSAHWSYTYNNGTLVISSSGTNAGGYFHQPGYYQLTYAIGGDQTLQTKTVTPSTQTQNVTADTAQGYTALKKVVVNPIPNTYVQPTSTQGATTYRASTAQQTISSGTYLTGTQTIAPVSQTNLTAANIKNGTTISISNGQSNIWSVTGSYSGDGGGGTSKNVQTVQSTSRRNNTSLGSITSLTCSADGTYEVYWTCARSNTSQTWGSQLYIDGSAHGSENTTWTNNVQNNHSTGVSIAKNQTVAVYGRSRSGYYIYAPQLTIIQTS